MRYGHILIVTETPANNNNKILMDNKFRPFVCYLLSHLAICFSSILVSGLSCLLLVLVVGKQMPAVVVIYFSLCV